MKKTLLALLLIAAKIHAWDAGGHMLVGQIAWELSSPQVRGAVDEMVATLDSRYNSGQPYNFTTVSCWMDDLRALPKTEYPWSTWHYVDSEKTDDGRLFKLPEPPHVVWAIGENLKTLRNKQAPAEERAKALGMIFHWVGDIHQPLHTTTWNDRGGNGYLISGVHFSDLMPGMVANLHTYWDKAFRFDVREGMSVELWAHPKVGERPKPGEGIITESPNAGWPAAKRSFILLVCMVLRLPSTLNSNESQVVEIARDFVASLSQNAIACLPKAWRANLERSRLGPWGRHP